MEFDKGVKAACPQCKKRIFIRSSQVEKRLRCPSCRSTFVACDALSVNAESSHDQGVSKSSDLGQDINQEVKREHESTCTREDPQHDYDAAIDAYELARYSTPTKVWSKAKESQKFQKSAGVVYRAALQVLRGDQFEVQFADRNNLRLRFAIIDDSGHSSVHSLTVFDFNQFSSEVELSSHGQDVDNVYSRLYDRIFGEIGKYILFAADSEVIQQKAAIEERGYRCPFCKTKSYPINRSKISAGGWVVFAVMLLVCFPMCFIGLFITDSYQVCSACGIKLNS